ncbi:MAG: MBL fold metallo-hydrolase [Anaerolineae bacterium]|nr:MBL fold metallo-hydrolase [Anaerolineae bacterium]
MQLTWLGRSCFELITARQTRILFDPYLDYYQEQHQVPYPFPDMVCVSHGHPDHFNDVPALIRDGSPALVIAIPQLCRALRELVPETQHRLFPVIWDDQVEVQGVRFFAFRSPPMQTSLYTLFQEFDVKPVLDFLMAFRQVADEILYLPLTSFGVEVDGMRVLHFVFEGEEDGDPVDVDAIGRQFAPDIALVGVHTGDEKHAAAYAAALGASKVIPHHYRAGFLKPCMVKDCPLQRYRPSEPLPAADLDLFTSELIRLSPATTILTLDELGSVEI